MYTLTVMFIVVSLAVVSGLGVTANLNFWSRVIFWNLALPEKCTDCACEPDLSVVSFLPGLALMKTTVLESMRTLSYFRLDTLHPSITKAAGRLFHSIAISNQLNAAPYLRHMPWQLLREETAPAVLNSRFYVCTSLAPRPMTVVFGLGTRLRVRVRTTLENGVLSNGQQTGQN